MSTAGSGNTNTSWQWDFGNGVTSSLRNPSITFTTAGNFTVTLRVTNDKGCTRIISKPNFINVITGVAAIFRASQPAVCSAPATISFTNTSTGPGTLSYLWNFGDGKTSTAQNPANNYTTNGNFTVTLITTSSIGCQDTARRTVSIGGLTSNFSGAITVCTNTPASFANTSSPTPTSVLWNFGDGDTSTSMNPSHTYTAPGTYTIRMYNNFGYCTDSSIKTIIVHPLPVADFSAPVTTRCQPNLTVNFSDNTTGSPVSWLWNFGDGSTSTLQNPAHTYTRYGRDTVTLIATTANGCSDTISKPDFVQIERAQIRIPLLPTRGCVPHTISPVAEITSLDAVTSYLWNFGDGTTSTSATPTHTYTTQGTYTVKLYITTSTGCTDSLIMSGSVKVGTLPFVDFTATPLTSCAFQPVKFNDLSTPADEWQWGFGDGGTSILRNPTYIYRDTGYFDITLGASNNGCTRTITKTNYVRIMPPISRFTARANCSDRLEFSFTDQSIGATGWIWDFGDGSPVSMVSTPPPHRFPAYGTYTVRLTVTNDTCSHFFERQIRVVDQAPDFSANATTICRGNQLTLTPLNIDPAATFSTLWEMGNGDRVSAGSESIQYLYPNSGTYNVRLIVRDINGCQDTAFKPAYIRVNGPRANFGPSVVSGCARNPTLFRDSSTTDGVNALTSWTWDFGDGNTRNFTAPPFIHTYTDTGIFTVRLRVTDASGCSDSLTRFNMIRATDPVPGFSSPDTLTCPGGLVRFPNTSTPVGVSSVWDFGDGSPTSALSSPTYRYPRPGIYTVKLVITDSAGCVDSIVRRDYIRVDIPRASFTASDTISACVPFEVRFTNTSTYYSSVSWDFGPGEGTSTRISPSHYYSAPGTYRVRLLITSRGGCRDSAFLNIRVDDTTGSRITYTPLRGCNPATVNLSTNTSATVKSYFWDFGDGTTATSTSPDTSHVYNSFGNFLPKVILMDPTGCLIPIAGIDTIRVSGSNLGFSHSPSFLCESGYVNFTDTTTSSDPIISWNWNFGDGQFSSQQHPTHQYVTPGIFDVTLTTVTASGCTNILTKQAAVKLVLRPLIDITGNTRICLNDSILHSGVFRRADTSAVTWSWVFPNGNSSTVQNPPVQTYRQAGNFTVTAIATNSSGCRDTATRNITVNPLPVSDMPALMTIQTGFPTAIPATYSANVNSWTWTPSRGLSCTSCPTPVVSPTFNTTYRVAYSDVNGCSGRDTVQIVVVCKDGNLFVPNTFSPNGDGSNDRFYPRGRGLYQVKTLRVFNRWGEVVFENRNFAPNDALQGWDGNYKGKKASADVYIYQVEIICDNGDLIKLEGDIALIL